MDLTQSSLYRLFIEQGRATWMGIVFAAVVAGLMQGGIIVVINAVAGSLDDPAQNLRYLLMFAMLLGAYSWANHFSTSRTIALSERTTFATYVDIADKLRRMSLIEFERIGKARIYAILHTNTDIILETSKTLASVGAGCVLIAFSALYIGYLSGIALLMVAVFYLFGYFLYRSNLGSMQSLLRQGVQKEERFKALFRYFLEGFKEIRLDERKGEALYDEHIVPGAKEARAARVDAEERLTTSGVFVQSYYYFLVASILFLLPRISSLPLVDVLQVAVVVLFSYGSMTRVVQAIPMIIKAERAVGALDALQQELAHAQDGAVPAITEAKPCPPTLNQTLRLQEVSFAYDDRQQSSHFQLGPISLIVEPGELLFIVGGNGSGKTTLLKLLCGLYRPNSGQLFLGDEPVDDASYVRYRGLFSAVFPDYFLFDRFYGHPDVDEGLLDETLRAMELTDHVSWEDGRFSEFNLSAGQSKRLALASARVDDRPILLLDEVAADLDPAFRRFFYESYLPQLKAEGKTVIAVSHDDKFFPIADRVIKLDAGRIAP